MINYRDLLKEKRNNKIYYYLKLSNSSYKKIIESKELSKETLEKLLYKKEKILHIETKEKSFLIITNRRKINYSVSLDMILSVSILDYMRR